MPTNEEIFIDLLKKCKPTLYQIDKFITDMDGLGFRDMGVKIKIRNYVNYEVEMQAYNNEKKDKTWQGKKIEGKLDKKLKVK